MRGEILIIIVFFAALTIFALVASFFIVKHEPPLPTSLPSIPNQIIWSENIRNNKNVTEFPPCYENDHAAKTIYGIIRQNNSIRKYYTLLDMLSIMLCLEKAQINNCKDTNISDRQMQITGLGGDPDDQNIREYASTFFEITNKPMSRFLVSTMYLIHRQMQLLESDYNFDNEDKKQLKGQLYSFYTTHLKQMSKLCQ